MRAQRAGNAGEARAAAVAAGRVFHLQQREVLDAALAQCARRRQPGHTAAGNHHARAMHDRRRRPLARRAQQVSAFLRLAAEAAFDRWIFAAAGQR
jgi:hypothetical protein